MLHTHQPLAPLKNTTMVSATVPVDQHETHVEEHAASSTAPLEDAKKTAAPVNVWKVRKEAMKAPSVESDAEKRVESIIENIKEVTLGKSTCRYVR